MRRRPITTAAVAEALREIFTTNATAAAEENVLVAKDEADRLLPYLFRIQKAMREEGGPGTRIRVDDLVPRAMSEAVKVWEQVNPSKWSLDHKWLALDEVADIEKIDAELGSVTRQAVEKARADRAQAEGGGAAASWRELVDAWDCGRESLHEHDLPGGERLDAREGQPARAGLPTGVVAAFDFYQRAVAAEWGTLTLHRATVGGEVGYLLYLDGAEQRAFVEILNAEGTTTDGARLHADQILGWDEFPGRVRLSKPLTTLGEIIDEEGLSEPEERAAAGQPPQRWEGEVRLDGTSLFHVQGDELGRIDFGAIALTHELRELAVAALDHLWRLPLRYGIHGDEPVKIGPRDAGVLTVGPFTRPTTGTTYQVANWRDIDDASFVLYYERDEHGLRLAISQFDN